MSAESILLQAIQSGNIDLVRSILQKDPERIHDRTAQGVPLTLLAAYHQQMDVFRYLIQQKKTLSFFEAIAVGNLKEVKTQLDATTGLLDTFSADGFTPLAFAAYFSQEEIAQWLVEHGANVNLASRNHMQIAPLHSAVAVQNVALAQLFLERGADPNKPQMEGIRPLHSAVHRGQREMVELLLRYGADPTLATDDGRTALDIAATEGKEEIQPLLK